MSRGMRKARWVGLIALAIFIPASLLYVWAVQNDYYGLPLGLNPQPRPTVVPIVLQYPPSGFPLTDGKSVSFLFDLVSKGTITQGGPVVAVSKTVSLNSPIQWRNAIVTFNEAFTYPVNSTEWLPNGLPVASFATNGVVNGVGGNFTFYWPTSGAYSPTISITFLNGTVRYHTYSNIQVPVASNIDVQNAKNARINTALTYIIVTFVFVEGFSIVMELTKEKEIQFSK